MVKTGCGAAPGVAVLLALAATWVRAAYVVSTVRPSPSGMGDMFGWAVASSGTALVVGAPRAYGGAGAAFVFECTAPTACTQQFTMQGGSTEQLGHSVAIYGATVLVGAPGKTPEGGQVYVWDCTYLNACVQRSALAGGAQVYLGSGMIPPTYRYNGYVSGISQMTSVTYSFTMTTMGTSVAIFNSLLLVGGPGIPNMPCMPAAWPTDSDSGPAYATSYKCSGAQTYHCPTLTSCASQTVQAGDVSMTPDTKMNSEYGASVALYQWTAVIGAPGRVGTLPSHTNVGAAYVLDCSAVTSCALGTILTAPGGMPGDRFGASVAIMRTAVVVGAAGNGKAYLFLCTTASACNFVTQLTSVYGGWPGAAAGAAANAVPLSARVPPFAVGIYYNGTAVVVGPTVYSCDLVAGTCTQRASLAAAVAAAAAPGGAAAALSSGSTLGFAVAVTANALFVSDVTEGSAKGTVYAFSCRNGTVVDCFDAFTAPPPPSTSSPATAVPTTATGGVPTPGPTTLASGGATVAPGQPCPTGWGGAGCNNCAIGYYGPSCATSCDACVNGYCASGTRGGCICFAGYAGTRCTDCAGGYSVSGGFQCIQTGATAGSDAGAAATATGTTATQASSTQLFGIALGAVFGLLALLILVGAGLFMCYLYGRGGRRHGTQPHSAEEDGDRALLARSKPRRPSMTEGVVVPWSPLPDQGGSGGRPAGFEMSAAPSGRAETLVDYAEDGSAAAVARTGQTTGQADLSVQRRV
jgi:hypothetical protein